MKDALGDTGDGFSGAGVAIDLTYISNNWNCPART